MKVFTFAALMGAAWAGEDKKGEPQLRLELDLADGSRIIGTPAIESVPVQTSYAKMDVPLKEILSMKIGEDHETAFLDLRSGDNLKGVVSLRPIKLETLFGKVSVGVEHINTLRVVLRNGAWPETLARGLILHYSFDRDEGEKVSDESGKGAIGSAHGAKWTVNGKTGGALEFDGQNDYVTGPADSPAFQNDEHTVSAWVRMPRSDGKMNAGIAGYWGPGADSGYGLCFAGSGQLGMIEGQKSTWQYALSGVPVDDGQWHHLVGIRKNSNALLYVDGIKQPGATDLKPLFPAGQKLMLGYLDAPQVPRQHFQGTMDEVMVFNRALSEEEIKQLFDCQK
jgi:hypothetical protein